MKKRNIHGMTFVEVLISLALFVMSVTSYLALYTNYQKSKADVNNSQIEKEILLQNVLEIKGSKLATLPTKSHCVTRTYDLGKNLINENVTAMTNESCPRPKPSIGQVLIIWQVLGAEKINVTFTPSAGLKLPKYTDTIRQFDLVALSLIRGNRTNVREMALSIFKRQ